MDVSICSNQSTTYQTAIWSLLLKPMIMSLFQLGSVSVGIWPAIRWLDDVYFFVVSFHSLQNEETFLWNCLAGLEVKQLFLFLSVLHLLTPRGIRMPYVIFKSLNTSNFYSSVGFERGTLLALSWCSRGSESLFG